MVLLYPLGKIPPPANRTKENKFYCLRVCFLIKLLYQFLLGNSRQKITPTAPTPGTIPVMTPPDSQFAQCLDEIAREKGSVRVNISMFEIPKPGFLPSKSCSRYFKKTFSEYKIQISLFLVSVNRSAILIHAKVSHLRKLSILKISSMSG